MNNNIYRNIASTRYYAPIPQNAQIERDKLVSNIQYILNPAIDMEETSSI